MPFLDVSDVLSDPDFATTFDVERTTVAVGDDGETSTTTTTTPGLIGVITPANSNDLKRMAEVERLTGAIAIHTSFVLHAGGLMGDGVTQATADIVTWQGRRYRMGPDGSMAEA